VHWGLEKCDGALRLIEIFEDDLFVYIVLEFQKMGSLLGQIMQRQMFTEKETKVIMTQLLLAVDFMHQKNIIHRDIKLDNVLINDI
jgi:serine/threonine protein kinase